MEQALLWKTGIAFISGGMITGAFGAHMLQRMSGMTPDRIHSWETASGYAIYNGLGLLALSLHPRLSTHRFAGPAIAFGGIVFSASIWCLTIGQERLKVLGPVTPLGGTVMIAGYLSLLFCNVN